MILFLVHCIISKNKENNLQQIATITSIFPDNKGMRMTPRSAIIIPARCVIEFIQSMFFHVAILVAA